MLASQMCASVSITRSSGIARSSALNVAAITRSLNMFNAIDRSSAGTISGAAPRWRSDLIAAVVDEIHLYMSADHTCRTSGFVALAAAPATATAR